MAEAVYYGGLAAAAKKSAVIIDETWSRAVLLKGIAGWARRFRERMTRKAAE
jgi:hypothetical protein